MSSREPSKYIIALIGVVGSGKTHIAKILSKRLGAARITTDEIRVGLRKRRRSYNQAPKITARRAERFLRNGQSVILDFDAINPARRRELRWRAREFEARLYFLEVRTPQRTILARLRKKRYTSGDLFKDADEATRVYFVRKKFREKFRHKRFTPRLRQGFGGQASFTVDNSRSLEPQIEKIVRAIKGL
ncbi:MAG: AAA family ATPase [Candidatus Sungbacteria bacterium]|uniref:AAA family ATPase n=1 Tax=Candidatus Sungiibacteriota bacterium TaxID=2750080 RepID=A0A932YZ31_9BACT|nr:AAA family ATPase [Candidatus Sungbacteria bacterium]